MSLRKISVLAILVLSGLGQSARAGFNNFSGGIPISFGTITANTGDINTATSFTATPAVYLGGASGDFSQYVPSFLTNFTFLASSITMSGLNPNSPPYAIVTPYSGLSFGSATFGTFTANSYEVLPSATQTKSFEFIGTFATGTYFANDPNMGSGAASFTVTFAQTMPGQVISGSGVLNVPPAAAVPEPSSLVLMGIAGAVALGVAKVRRKRAVGDARPAWIGAVDRIAS